MNIVCTMHTHEHPQKYTRIQKSIIQLNGKQYSPSKVIPQQFIVTVSNVSMRCDVVSVRGFCRSNATITETFFSLIDQTLLVFPFRFCFCCFFFYFIRIHRIQLVIYLNSLHKNVCASIRSNFRSNDENKNLFIKSAGRLYSSMFYIQLWNLVFGLQNQIIHQNKWSHHRLFFALYLLHFLFS